MWLARLVEATEERLADGYYEARPEAPLEPIGSLKDAIERAYPALVAEIKPGRPGQEPREVDVAARAQAYADGGACAISVLTDPDHFGGALANLQAARIAGLPLLMKDFLIHPDQVAAGAAWGASAVLLIARLHTENHTEVGLDELVAACHEHEVEALVEVVTEDELDLAIETGADVIGINVRDLDTLEMDPDRPARLLSHHRPKAPVLHLSGIETHSDLRRALSPGAQGVLVGSHLMGEDHPRSAVRELLTGGHGG